MRWATLPPSGRLPLNDPPTTLDPWPVGIPHIPFPFLKPEAAYGFEQSCVYPTKRALMLVSKAWAELAVEFMYESLVIDYFGVGRLEQALATLEGPTGTLLKKWVRRVDIWFKNIGARDYACERLARIGLPNLRVQYVFSDHRVMVEPPPILLCEQPLHLVEFNRSPIFARLTSCPEAFASLRCLTLFLTAPSPIPLLLPSNLRRLTILALSILVQDFSSTLSSAALPNLTHLTLHYIDILPDRFVPSMGLINRIGPQLRHLTLTTSKKTLAWTEADIRTILRVCTQLTELVTSSFVGLLEADPSGYKHSILQTLGVLVIPSTSESDYQSFFDIFSNREAFPKLSTMRIIVISTKLEVKAASRLIEPYVLRLRGHGIRFEDSSGRDFLRVPLENPNPNQEVLSPGRANVVS